MLYFQVAFCLVVIVFVVYYNFTISIFRMVKDFSTSLQFDQIKRILKVLGDDFAYSSNPNTRKGGLIGLAATAIALGKVSCLLGINRM